MRITTKFLLFLLIFGCKNQTQSKTESISKKISKNYQIKKQNPIYDLIIRKKETADDLEKEFSYDSIIGLSNDEKSKLKKTGLDDGYYLIGTKFLKEPIDSIDFTFFYKATSGIQIEKVLRIKRPDKTYELTLALSGGDGGESWTESVEFLSDSIFERILVSKSMIIDDHYLVANRIDSMVKRYEYNNKFDFAEKRIDTFKIANTGFIDYPIEQISSSPQLSYKDSIHLLIFWRKTAFSMLDTINSNVSNSKIESLLNDYFDGKGGLNGGGIYPSPDGLFKILVVRGESCGAYCNPFWESEIVLSNWKRINNLNFKEIDNIYLMPDGKYLVIQESFGRPASVFTETTKSAILFSLDDDKIRYYPFNYSYPIYDELQNNKNYDPSGKLSFSQQHFIDTEQYLTYDEESKKLKYGYGTDFSYCCQIDSAYVFKGEFEYKNGSFIHLNENKEYIKVD